MRDQNFGIEIELTGLTRERAAEVVAEYFGTRAQYDGGGYSAWSANDTQGRKWKFVSDASIDIESKRNQPAEAVELVSPICVYDDIPTIQEIVRKLRDAGAIANKSCGIHVHINAAPYDAQKLRNLTNIMASKEDLIYKALQVSVSREHDYCQKVDNRFLEELNRRRPTTLDQVKNIWYNGRDGSGSHYDSSRYHCLNLHAVFSKGTCEFRLFNGTTHAGKIKSYIQLCLAISNQALTQKSASRQKTASSNEKYTFRTWLLRLGMIGDEFKTARLHLLEHLEGSIAWKDPEQGTAAEGKACTTAGAGAAAGGGTGAGIRGSRINRNRRNGNDRGRARPRSFYVDVKEVTMQKSKTNLYIAYGSNLNLRQMEKRCPTAEVIGTAELEGYDLLFRGGRHGAVATVEPLEDGKVPVLLWKLRPQDERALDIYEGWPSFYRKEIHEIEFGGKTVPAMVYVMNDGHDYGEPSGFYYNTIREGYKSAGFDTDYLDDAVERSTALAMEQDELMEQAHEEMDWPEFDFENDFEQDEPNLFNMRYE